MRRVLLLISLLASMSCEDPATTSVVALSAGDDETCAIVVNGAVAPVADATVEVGGEDGGEDGGGDGGADDAGVVDAGVVDAGPPPPPPAVSPGVLRCWGNGVETATFREEILPTSVALAWGETRCVTPATGSVLCWGRNDRGQLTVTPGPEVTVPAPLRGVVRPTIRVARFGGSHVCGIDAGRLLCWGAGSEGQLGDGGRTDRARAEPPRLLETAQSVALGADHTCAIVDGVGYCWGSNEFGQVGDGSRNDAVTPTAVSAEGMGALTAFALGRGHTCALDDAGAVWCWGDDSFGQVGQTSVGLPRLRPLQVARLGGVAQLSSGRDHVCAVEASGPVRCWGRNDRFQTSHPNGVSLGQIGDVGISSPRMITLGADHGCALLDDGVRCWGASEEGRLGRPDNGNGRLALPVRGI